MQDKYSNVKQKTIGTTVKLDTRKRKTAVLMYIRLIFHVKWLVCVNLGKCTSLKTHIVHSQNSEKGFSFILLNNFAGLINFRGNSNQIRANVNMVSFEQTCGSFLCPELLLHVRPVVFQTGLPKQNPLSHSTSSLVKGETPIQPNTHKHRLSLNEGLKCVLSP